MDGTIIEKKLLTKDEGKNTKQSTNEIEEFCSTMQKKMEGAYTVAVALPQVMEEARPGWERPGCCRV